MHTPTSFDCISNIHLDIGKKVARELKTKPGEVLPRKQSRVYASNQEVDELNNVLLPASPAVVPYVIELNEGCWNAQTLQEEEEIDNVVELYPTTSKLTLECNEFQEDEESCHKAFGIKVKESRSSFRSFSFERMSTPQEDHKMKIVKRRVDVHVSDLHSIEIFTTTRRVEVGETETLKVFGRDIHQNVFTSLVGLDFEWIVDPGEEHLDVKKLPDIAGQENSMDQSRGQQLVFQQEKLARALTVCPGPLLTVLKGTPIHFLLCLKQAGCFDSLTNPKLVQLNENYKWSWNKPSYFNTLGTFSVVVEDQNEKSNSAKTEIIVSELKSIQHNIAKFDPATCSLGQDLDRRDECPYYKSRDSEWPVLSKKLPKQEEFKKNLGTYFLIKGKKYVFLGLAKTIADLFVPPHLTEKPQFQFADKSLISINEKCVDSASVIQAEKVGSTLVTLSFREMKSTFTINITDPVTTDPQDLVVMTYNCQMNLRVEGGSGTYRSPSPYKSKALHVSNWTRFETNQVDGDGKFTVWDEIEPSNFAEVRWLVRNQVEQLKIRGGKHHSVVVGGSIDLCAEGWMRNQIFHCCQIGTTRWEEDSETPILSQKPHQGGKDRACTCATFHALQPGTTQVLLYWEYGIESVYITVFRPLTVSPGYSVTNVGCKQKVNVLDGPEKGQIYVNGEKINDSHFFVECEKAIKKTFEVQSRSEGKVFETVLEVLCVIPDRCEIELNGVEFWQPILSHHFEPATVLFPRVVLFEKSNNVTQSCMSSHLYFNDKEITPNNRLTLPSLGETNQQKLTITGKVPSLKFVCSREISITSPMRVLPKENSLWFWSGCDAKFRIEDGSGRFNLTSNIKPLPFQARNFAIMESLGQSQQLTISDVDFFPIHETTKSISFSKTFDMKLDLIHPEHIVQYSTIHLQLNAFNGVHENHQFDWSLYGKEHVSLTWEPVEAIQLIEQTDVRKFKLQTIQNGQVTFTFKICSYCDLSKCITSKQEFVIEKYHSITLFPGSRYNVSDCNDDIETADETNSNSAIEFENCVNLVQNDVDDNNNIVEVFDNGTLVTSCSTGEAYVRCTKKRSKEVIFFQVFVDFPTDIETFPKIGSNWLYSKTQKHQIHARLGIGKAGTCSVRDIARIDTWKFEIQTEEGVKGETITSSQSGASITVSPNVKGIWSVNIFVQIGTLNRTCSGVSPQLSAQRRFHIYESPTLLTPNRILIPIGSKFPIKTIPSSICSLGCDCQGFKLEGDCTIVALKNSSSQLCSVMISSKSEFVFPHHVVTVESRNIALLSVSREDNELFLTLHDEFDRIFTPGWSDVFISRRIQFSPPKHVRLESTSLFANQLNFSQPLSSIKLKSSILKSSGSLITTLYESDQLLSRAVTERIEICSSKLFGRCFSLWERLGLIFLLLGCVVTILAINLQLGLGAILLSGVYFLLFQ